MEIAIVAGVVLITCLLVFLFVYNTYPQVIYPTVSVSGSAELGQVGQSLPQGTNPTSVTFVSENGLTYTVPVTGVGNEYYVVLANGHTYSTTITYNGPGYLGTCTSYSLSLYVESNSYGGSFDLICQR